MWLPVTKNTIIYGSFSFQIFLQCCLKCFFKTAWNRSFWINHSFPQIDSKSNKLNISDNPDNTKSFIFIFIQKDFVNSHMKIYVFALVMEKGSYLPKIS